MSHRFIWTDLSALDLKVAKHFYRTCMGWSYQDMGDGYLICEAEKLSSAALFEMPEKFQNIGMPSFWMSYIQVDDIEQVVSLAETHGGKVEVRPTTAPDGAIIALIRDPSGAGFTCYQGDDLGGREQNDKTGRMVWNELHVSELDKVESFYSAVFGWQIKATSEANRYEIFTQDSRQAIAGISVTSNEIKGDKEYWGVYFSVDDLSEAVEKIEQAGGEIIEQKPIASCPSLLAYDAQGAAFYVVEQMNRPWSETASEKTTSKAATPKATTPQKSTLKWRAMLGLLVVSVAFVMNINWVWGVIFLLWIVPDIKRGSTYFFEQVDRTNNPILFWLIVIAWIVLSAFFFTDGLW